MDAASAPWISVSPWHAGRRWQRPWRCGGRSRSRWRAVESLVAGNLQAVGMLGELGAHRAEVLSDQGDAVGLLDAKLLRVADDQAIGGVGRDGGEHGKLVDDLRGERSADDEGLVVEIVSPRLTWIEPISSPWCSSTESTLMRPPSAVITSSSAARVGFMPSESSTRLESGKSSAAQRKKAAEEMSPGTVASMAWSFCPPGMESLSRRCGSGLRQRP